MSIGNRITQLRREHNVSQEYIAQELGVSRQAVSKWEQDLSAPDTNNLIALSRLFEVSVEYLAVGTVHPAKQLPQPRHSTQRIIGFLLLSFGLFAMILAFIFSLFLLIPAIVLLVFGILCLAVRRHLWIALCIAAVLVAALIALGISTLFGYRSLVSHQTFTEELSSVYTVPSQELVAE